MYITNLLKRFCNNLEIKLAFSSFKIRQIFSLKILYLLIFVHALPSNFLVQAQVSQASYESLYEKIEFET